MIIHVPTSAFARASVSAWLPSSLSYAAASRRDKSARQGGFWFQLKSQRSPIRESITDGAYAAMMEAIQTDRTPNCREHFFNAKTPGRKDAKIQNVFLAPSRLCALALKSHLCRHRKPNFSDKSGKMGRRGTPPSDSFTTADAYAFERELGQLHPDNRNIKAKIRQQLQVLRDAGLLLHVERGEWRLP